MATNKNFSRLFSIQDEWDDYLAAVAENIDKFINDSRNGKPNEFEKWFQTKPLTDSPAFKELSKSKPFPTGKAFNYGTGLIFSAASTFFLSTLSLTYALPIGLAVTGVSAYSGITLEKLVDNIRKGRVKRGAARKANNTIDAKDLGVLTALAKTVGQKIPEAIVDAAILNPTCRKYILDETEIYLNEVPSLSTEVLIYKTCRDDLEKAFMTLIHPQINMERQVAADAVLVTFSLAVDRLLRHRSIELFNVGQKNRYHLLYRCIDWYWPNKTKEQNHWPRLIVWMPSREQMVWKHLRPKARKKSVRCWKKSSNLGFEFVKC